MVAGGQGGLAEWIDKFKANSRVEAVEEATSPDDSSTMSSPPESPAANDQKEQFEEGAMDVARTTSTPMKAA